MNLLLDLHEDSPGESGAKITKRTPRNRTSAFEAKVAVRREVGTGLWLGRATH
jgi:hypothetical protein